MFSGRKNLFSTLQRSPPYDVNSSTKKCVLLSCYVRLSHPTLHKNEMRELWDCGKIIKLRILQIITRQLGTVRCRCWNFQYSKKAKSIFGIYDDRVRRNKNYLCETTFFLCHVKRFSPTTQLLNRSPADEKDACYLCK